MYYEPHRHILIMKNISNILCSETLGVSTEPKPSCHLSQRPEKWMFCLGSVWCWQLCPRESNHTVTHTVTQTVQCCDGWHIWYITLSFVTKLIWTATFGELPAMCWYISMLYACIKRSRGYGWENNTDKTLVFSMLMILLTCRGRETAEVCVRGGALCWRVRPQRG